LITGEGQMTSGYDLPWWSKQELMEKLNFLWTSTFKSSLGF